MIFETEVILNNINTDISFEDSNSNIESIDFSSIDFNIESIDLYPIDFNIEISFIQGLEGKPGDTPVIGINNNWWINGVDTGRPSRGLKGYTPLKGTDYFDGQNGRGIQSIVLISTLGQVKTYRILFSDNTNFEYQVVNGSNGINGITPTIGENGNWFIGLLDTGMSSRANSIDNKEKKSSIDSGNLFDMSITDDYLFICTKSGETGSAVWKKALLFQT